MSAREQIDDLRARMQQAIVGQADVIERLLIGLLANGNLLVEGLPGLAKTRAIKALARNLEAKFSRIQFTPDLLPSDVTGTEMYYQSERGSEFRFMPGPIFANIVLADEINRAPAKVQAALLEAMEERQVTVAGNTHAMEPLFMVMATQNPIEQEGTYPLPEAQMDRFLMHVLIGYLEVDDEVDVIRIVRAEEIAATQAQAPGGAPAPGDAPGERPDAAQDAVPDNAPDTGESAAPAKPIPQGAVFAARREIGAVHVSAAMERYMGDLVNATRYPGGYGEDLARWIEVGGSPRASIALDKCGRAHAWLSGRDYMDPEDVRAIAPDVLRHRLALSYEAQGEGVSADAVVEELIRQVALP